MVAELTPEKKETFDPHTVCIATATHYKNWYPGNLGADEENDDKLRGDLAIKFIKSAIANGFQIVDVDGGSSYEFRDEIGKLGVVLENEDVDDMGMSSSRSKAFKIASRLRRVKVIGWSEPEKVDVVERFVEELATPILNDEAVITVPHRTEASFATYPTYQAESEKRFNKLWNSTLEEFKIKKKADPELDVSFGPKFFLNRPDVLSKWIARYGVGDNRQKVSKLIKPYRYSNATFFPIIAALNEGYKVKSIDVDYIHPEEQTEFESRSPEYIEKRRIQLIDIVLGARELCKLLKGRPESVLTKIT